MRIIIKIFAFIFLSFISFVAVRIIFNQYVAEYDDFEREIFRKYGDNEWKLIASPESIDGWVVPDSAFYEEYELTFKNDSCIIIEDKLYSANTTFLAFNYFMGNSYRSETFFFYLKDVYYTDKEKRTKFRIEKHDDFVKLFYEKRGDAFLMKLY